MSRLLEEIAELPSALARMLAFYRGEGRGLLDQWAERLAGKSEVLFGGMGTSQFAPMVGAARLAEAGVSARAVDAGEWLHYGAALPGERGPVVLISQSGESVEVVKLIEQGKAGDEFVGVTNHLDSTLGRGAGLALPMLAGEEAAISTKTYTNTLALSSLLAAAAQAPAEVDAMLEQLAEASASLHSAEDARIESAAAALAGCDGIACVGRGPTVVAARQCALTFMEGVRILTAWFTGGAFRHGPFEMCGPKLGVVILAPQGKTLGITEGVGREAAGKGARVVFITDADLAEGENVSVIRVAGGGSEELFALACSGAQPMLLDRLARARGHEAGTFRYGGKITTRE